jgi:hypothetical protein
MKGAKKAYKEPVSYLLQAQCDRLLGRVGILPWVIKNKLKDLSILRKANGSKN